MLHIINKVVGKGKKRNFFFFFLTLKKKNQEGSTHFQLFLHNCVCLGLSMARLYIHVLLTSVMRLKTSFFPTHLQGTLPFFLSHLQISGLNNDSNSRIKDSDKGNFHFLVFKRNKHSTGLTHELQGYGGGHMWGLEYFDF